MNALPPGGFGDRDANADEVGNNVVAFIEAAMNPVRYVGDASKFHDRRERLNQVAIFLGLSVGDDGKVCRVSGASTLTEAQARAGRLRVALERRGRVHPDVFHACRAELIQNNCFHAVLETTPAEHPVSG